MITCERPLVPIRSMTIAQKKMEPKHGSEIPARTALYFYSIIVLAFILPVAIAADLVYARFVVSVIVAVSSVTVVGGSVYAYRKIASQIAALQAIVGQLHDREADCEISMLGGLMRIRIEQNRRKVLPPPEVDEDKREAGRTS